MSQRFAWLSQTVRAGSVRRVVAVAVLMAGGWALAAHPPTASVAHGELGLRLNRLTGTSAPVGEGVVLLLPGVHELRRHPLQCPVAFIGGTESAEMKQVGMAMTHKVVGSDHPDRLRMIEGSHLFPMEKPHDTAVAIDASLKALLR